MKRKKVISSDEKMKKLLNELSTKEAGQVKGGKDEKTGLQIAIRITF